jgi:hypothetical protein
MILIPGLALTAAIHAAAPVLDNVTVLASERALASASTPTSWSERPWPESTFIRIPHGAEVGDPDITDLESLLEALVGESDNA